MKCHSQERQCQLVTWSPPSAAAKGQGEGNPSRHLPPLMNPQLPPAMDILKAIIAIINHYIWYMIELQNGRKTTAYYQHTFLSCRFWCSIPCQMSCSMPVDEVGVACQNGASVPPCGCAACECTETQRPSTADRNWLMAGWTRIRTFLGIPLSFGVQSTKYSNQDFPHNTKRTSRITTSTLGK